MRLFGFCLREYHDAPIHLVPLREEIFDKLLGIYCLPLILYLVGCSYPLLWVVRKTKPFLFMPNPIIEIKER
jgi:hypothetical protein